MKLARFTIHGSTRIGRVDGPRMTDLTQVLGDRTMRDVIADLDRLRAPIMACDGPFHALDAVRLEIPVPDPQKFLAIGMNYARHAEEARAAGIAIPETQMWFNKQVSCLNAPFDPVVKPDASDKMDYEIELGVVIGRRCRHVRREEARGVIAGYLIVNDVSARDWLPKSPTFTLGKSFDTHGPAGPWITTDDEIADPLDLRMQLSVNGELRQDARTNDMIYDIYDQIAYLSTVMTLQPGDILATGTPSGIGAPTGRFLVPGDRMELEIEGLGRIACEVAAETAAASARAAVPAA
ncbi:fumarylacetoacetate hydrolase family protein [Mangrovicoccus sp. HB161399]|uniref:fumarylacetoacetate hydrolase family protein n=1 Tax=Mangrovicoccus sp. HB161399 TaxID=2720392 RepID=UPI00155655AD|nr:fumarylacetoacetate hydrolase family protein [Mangrovicoccus sp. HB161399]